LISCNKSEDTIILIPEGYNGSIKIWFNKDDGIEKKYEDGKRLYIIPKNGVLKTKFESQFGYHFTEYYLVTGKGQRKEISAIFDLGENVMDTLDKRKVYAYRFMSSGDVVRMDSLGTATEKSEPGINFMVGNPMD